MYYRRGKGVHGSSDVRYPRVGLGMGGHVPSLPGTCRNSYLPQIRRASRRHCGLYKFTYLLISMSFGGVSGVGCMGQLQIMYVYLLQGATPGAHPTFKPWLRHCATAVRIRVHYALPVAAH